MKEQPAWPRATSDSTASFRDIGIRIIPPETYLLSPVRCSGYHNSALPSTLLPLFPPKALHISIDTDPLGAVANTYIHL